MVDWILAKVETGLMIKETRMLQLQTRFAIRAEKGMSVTMASLDNFQAWRRINGLIERQDLLVEARLSIIARELKVGPRKSSSFM